LEHAYICIRDSADLQFSPLEVLVLREYYPSTLADLGEPLFINTGLSEMLIVDFDTGTFGSQPICNNVPA
jgi:hypothetical protein